MPRIRAAVRCRSGIYRRAYPRLCLFLAAVYVSVVDHRGSLLLVSAGTSLAVGEDTPPPTLPGNPLISILIPCFNEEKNARETISAALAQRYANLEVIAINDGSSDNTARCSSSWRRRKPRLRVIHLAANQGKAVALKAGAAAARGDLLVCIDGDALLDRDTAASAGRAVDPLSARRGGHRQSADPHPIHADRPHSGWGVLVDHWAYQTDAADLWPGLYRLRRNRRLPAPRRWRTSATGARI